MIDQLGKGCVPDVPDARDFSAEPLMGASAPVDWNTGLRLPDPGHEDQGSSDSCVAQAWSYYHNQIHAANYSRRDLFARIAQAYGASIRDGGLAIVNAGQATRDEVPDPQTETPQNMRDKTGINASEELPYEELNSFVIDRNSIDVVAQGIRDYKGVVFGVTGSNEGWQDMQNPRPPASGENTWGHALYAMGYHLHNGVKCIIAKSSWCSVVQEHHISEAYFVSGNTFNAWTLISKQQQPMNQAKIVKSKTSPTVYICYPVPSMDYLTSTATLQGISVPVQIPDSDSL
jgi:hypothetical protein